MRPIEDTFESRAESIATKDIFPKRRDCVEVLFLSRCFKRTGIHFSTISFQRVQRPTNAKRSAIEDMGVKVL